MIKPLHQQLADKVRQIEADEALVAEELHLHSTHQAKERLPRLRDELATLRTDIDVATLAKYELDRALAHMRTQAIGSRELALAITDAETAAWRLRNHLGDAAGCKPDGMLTKPVPVVPPARPR